MKNLTKISTLGFMLASAFAVSSLANSPQSCPKFAGVYLTAINAPGDFATRSLVSFYADGTALASDSHQDGLNVAGTPIYDPFGESHGKWTCSKSGGTMTINATLYNFTQPGYTTDYVTPNNGKRIARAVYDLTSTPTGFTGTIDVCLFPMELDDNNDDPDPLDPSACPIGFPFPNTVDGKKI